jgi:hypothetical protein
LAFVLQGKFEKTLQYLEKCLSIEINSFGHEHERCIKTRSLIFLVQFQLQRNSSL